MTTSKSLQNAQNQADASLTDIKTTAPDAIEATDAYNRLFNFLSGIKSEDVRDKALADLNRVYAMTAEALDTADQLQRIAHSLKAMLDEAIWQRNLTLARLEEERERAAELRELGVAVEVCNFFGIDPNYARPLLDYLQGVEEDYIVDEFITDRVREVFARIEAEFMDADMIDNWDAEVAS